MKGTFRFYLWVCIVAYVTWGGGALPAVLGKELVMDDVEEQDLAEWVQGQETPLRNQFWEEEEEEDEGEEGAMSPETEKRQYPGGKRQYPGGKRQYPGGKRQYPGGKRQYPGGKRQYPGGKRSQYLEAKRQFVGGEPIPSPELRQYPGGKRQYPGGKRQYPGGKRQYPGGKRQYPGGKRQYPGGKRSEIDQDVLPMEIRQYPGGKRQYPGGKRQYPGGKRQYPGGKRQFPGGKRQFVGGEPSEQVSSISKRFAPEDDDTMDFSKLVQMYALNNDLLLNEQDLELEDLLDDILVDTRPEMDLERARELLLENANADDALALDLSAVLQDREGMEGW